ncbi:hypothetical protein GO755_33625 [Spirosoma sp. HMF4905]|uniref:Uncharacterized protein n=1 Tax=Spirosoma arboris TaxID=2682092 RepID=A0A7K1SN36_9BACT|nr:hypothetical protein [Spirosoma arboris]MVM35016.1 hypothetical protein [Spirosoma arboris]
MLNQTEAEFIDSVDWKKDPDTGRTYAWWQFNEHTVVELSSHAAGGHVYIVQLGSQEYINTRSYEQFQRALDEINQMTHEQISSYLVP